MNQSHLEFVSIIQPISPFLDAFQLAFQKEFDSIQTLYNSDFKTDHFIKGKYLRPILFFLCQGLVDQPKQKSVDTAVMVELVHTASLIHDDVIDKSHKRRGHKTLNAVLGNHFSVLVGDYLIARMMMMSCTLKNEEMTCLSEAIMNMTRSELQQAICEKEGCVEEEVYFSIIQGKTGALFQAAGALAGHAMRASKEQIRQLYQFGLQFGLAFQIQDDLLDFTGSAEEMGKPVHQDLQGGRWTLPFIQVFHGLPENEKETFRQQMIANEVSRERLMQMVQKHHGIEKTKSYLETHSQKALQILSAFPESKYQNALQQLIRYNMDRHS